MGLFESDYQRNVSTELERRMRALEESKQVTNDKITEMQTVIDFAKDAKLLKDITLRNMQRRIEQIKREKDYKTFLRENISETDDGYTNPHEMSKKFTLEQIKSQINEQRTQTQQQNQSNIIELQSKRQSAKERSH